MPAQLRITVRFLDGAFHGRGDGGEPEWPPSPLRLFQAIVAAAATRWSDDSRSIKDATALRWLEQQPPPTIVATRRAAIQPRGYRLYVPDNVGDLVAKKWENGDTAADIADYRTDKFVRPTRLVTDSAAGAFPAVYYLWPITASEDGLLEALLAAARSISRLGWGVDLVAADAAVEDSDYTGAQLFGERWLPVETVGGATLRVPVAGTLDDLKNRHSAFLRRIKHLDGGGEIFVPVPPLATFRVVTYLRDDELSRPPFAVFALRKPDDSAFAAFDPQWRRLHLTGMLRHTASRPDFAAALGWDESKVNAFVLGHETDSTKPTANVARLVFIPLPSIEWRGEKRGRTVGTIRRVLVTVGGGKGQYDATEFSHIIRALEGRELIEEKNKQPVAFLRRQSENDGAVAPYYAEESSAWSTVTPVILPGYDDPRKLRKRLNPGATPPLTAEEKNELIRKLDTRIEQLLRKAIVQAGLPEALARHAELEWRSAGFCPGADLASRYAVPDQNRRFRRLHVRITWRSPDGQPLKVAGPICLGGGKYTGLGLFAAFPGNPQ